MPDPTQTELIEIQVPPSAPQPSVTSTATDMIIPPRRNADRLRHFPDNVYDISAESHLTRFVKTLLGDAGVGWWKKRLTIQRMRSTLQGSHFYDLDRFYGPLFGLKRSPEEVLPFNPYQGTATRDQWDDVYARDASFRSRIEQFSQAITYGATPVGMELIAEALLSVDCEINEVWVKADVGFQTWAEIEALYSTAGDYGDAETQTWAELEGYGLAILAGNERRVFIVRPKRPITLSEAYDLSKVLDKLKPADARFEIDAEGVELHEPLTIRGAFADSTHWEVVSKITPLTPATNLPYTVMSGDPEEQPRPPFSGYQGEAWSYVQDLAGVSASEVDIDGVVTTSPPQRVKYSDGSILDFSANQAILPSRLVQSGRQVSDAVLVSFPYGGQPGLAAFQASRPDDLSKLYVDGVPLDDLVEVMETLARTDPFQQNPQNRYWVTPPRMQEDNTEEVLEFRLKRESWVNYISFEMVRYPHRVIAEAYDAEGGEWIELFQIEEQSSQPRFLNPGDEVALRSGHPQHAYPAHWNRIGRRVPPQFTRRVRLRLIRGQGDAPVQPLHSAHAGPTPTQAIPYSLAVRSADVGYRISNRSDFDFLPGPVVGQTVDAIGSQVQFEMQEQLPSRALDGLTTTAWRSEPQPINYGVINFYLDTRNEEGTDGQVIDRFYLDPTHAGANFTIYYSNDVMTTPDSADDFVELTWTPIPRNYTLQKGFVHIPQTRARWFKFEFSGLVPEAYESFVPVTRHIKLFPQQIIRETVLGYGHAHEALLPGMGTAITTAEELRYRDALQALSATTNPPLDEYRPTEALFVSNVEGAGRAKDQAWQFGFTPWHQREGQYPRFSRVGPHAYDSVQAIHNTKVAFFVGLRTIQAYRTKYEEDENTVFYWDTYDDFRNLALGFTWIMNPGYLTSVGTSPPVVFSSRTFYSRNNIRAVQFATVQSDPLQLVPDHTFHDPSLPTYTWDDPDYFQRVGDAQLVYDPSDFSVINMRFVVPPPKPQDRSGGIVQPIVNPVFSHTALAGADEIAAEETDGGIRTPLMSLSEAGRAYAAARFTMLSEQSSPLILRVHDSTAADAVIAEIEFEAQEGETVEGYIGFDIPDASTVVWIELIQEGKSDDTWKTFALSLFDDGMLWEFSNDGGSNWYPAVEIRNNDTGILTFPALGNQLRYRCTAYRPNRWVSAIKIRPHYAGVGNARPTGTHRGPNVSVFDEDVPINMDPLFTTWKKPIPYWWFAASRRFPLLLAEGAVGLSEYARFFGRPASDTVSAPTDQAAAEVIFTRSVEERLDLSAPVSDVVTRGLIMQREVEDLLPEPIDSASGIVIIGEFDPLNAPIPDEV